MRRTFRALALFVGLACAVPAAALTITASERVIVGSLTGFQGRSVGPLRGQPAHDVNSIDDETIDAFEVLLFPTFPLAGFHAVSVDRSSIETIPPRSLGGRIQIIDGQLVTSSGFGRRNLVWVNGAPTHEAPIPEPGAALLFGVGTLLVGWRLRGRR